MTTAKISVWGGRSRWILGALIVAAVGVVAAAVVSKSGMREGTIPAGTRIVAALNRTVSTEHSRVGDRIELTTRSPIELSEGASVPDGAVIEGEVTHSEGGGRIAGAPELTLRFTHLQIDGRDHVISAEPFRVRGKNDALESAAEIGGGAVVGGVVGAIAHATVPGVVIGAVLGTGVAVATKGNQIVLPAGQRLRVTIEQPLTVSYKPASGKAKEEEDARKP
jgi:predicted outer membrane lipoprotein